MLYTILCIIGGLIALWLLIQLIIFAIIGGAFAKIFGELIKSFGRNR
jgi:hypothetical protein